MKVDVVYKIGATADWPEFQELKYSLRSVEKNFESLRNVYIVGNKPQWLQNVIHIPAKDPYRTNKDGNLINKMIMASVHPDISEFFVNISDDQYFMNPVKAEDMMHPIIDNSHIQFVPNSKLNRWQSRLKRTVDILKKNGFKHNCYEAHCPYLLDSKNYMKTLMQYDYGVDIGYCGNTLYFNTINAPGRVKTNRDMLRVTKPMTRDEIMSKLAFVRFMNNTKKGLTDTFKQILQEKFPNPSKFEMF